MDKGARLVSDQQNERATRVGVFKLYIDLARGRDETHLDPNGRERLEDEEPRKVGKRDGHTFPTTPRRKALPERWNHESVRLNWSENSAR